MPIFEVTTAITAYQTYTVEAANEDEACALVRRADRAEIPSRENGYGGDEQIIACRDRENKAMSWRT